MKKLKRLISIILIISLLTCQQGYGGGWLAPAGIRDLDIFNAHANLTLRDIVNSELMETEPVMRAGFIFVQELLRVGILKAQVASGQRIKLKRGIDQLNKNKIVDYLSSLEIDASVISLIEQFINCFFDHKNYNRKLLAQRVLLKEFLEDPENICPIWKTVSLKRYKKVEISAKYLITALIWRLLKNKSGLENFLSSEETIKLLKKELKNITAYLPIDIYTEFLHSMLAYYSSEHSLFMEAGLILIKFYSQYVIWDPREGRRPTFREGLEIIQRLKESPLYSRYSDKIENLESIIRKRQEIYGQITDKRVMFDETGTIVREVNEKGEIVPFEPEGIWDITVEGKSLKEILSMMINSDNMDQFRTGIDSGKRDSPFPESQQRGIKSKLFLIPMHKIFNLAVITLKTYLEKRIGKDIDVSLPSRLSQETITWLEDGYMEYDKQFFEELDQSEANIVGISALSTRHFHPSTKITPLLKELEKKDVFIIMGGPLVSYTNVINNVFESLEGNEPKNIILVRGEGEEALKELCEIIGDTRPSRGLSKEQMQKIKNMKSTGVWVKIGDRHIIKDYNKQNICSEYLLPDPKLAFMTGDGNYDMRIRLTGGCPYNCAFCNYGIRKHHNTDINHFISWLKEVLELWNKEEPLKIIIEDDNFLAWKNYVRELNEKMAGEGLSGKVVFSCRGSSVDSFIDYADGERKIDEQYIETVVELGMREISCGADGATNAHIGIHKNRKPNRIYRVQDIMVVAKILRGKGVDIYNNVIGSNPYTSFHEFVKSLFVVRTSQVFSSTALLKDTKKNKTGASWNVIAVPYVVLIKGTLIGNEMALFGMGEPGISVKYIDYKTYSFLMMYDDYIDSDEIDDPEREILNVIFTFYPYLWEEVLDDLCRENDIELKALGMLAKAIYNYFMSMDKENKNRFIVSIEATLNVISDMMKECRSYDLIVQCEKQREPLQSFFEQLEGGAEVIEHVQKHQARAAAKSM